MFKFPMLPAGRFALLLLAGALTAAPAWADTYSYSGTTAGAPTFNRPTENGAALSTLGTSVPYSVLQFQVSLGGTYEFLSTPQIAGFDNFTILYANSFDPLAPTANFVIADDDIGGVGVASGFTTTLSAATPYFFVTTGYVNSDFGLFNNTITGPGGITPVDAAPIPEPATLMLLSTGLAGVGAAIKRRRGK